MADRLSPAARSAHMARIRRADTKPEWIVRRLLHRMGYRFRLQWKPAPGRPDVAFPGRQKLIHVHGCFWHQHDGCRLAHMPSTRRGFWQAKFDRNRARDARDLQRAHDEGWETLVIWECETAEAANLEGRLRDFLGAPKLAKSPILDLPNRPVPR
ncbi:MAG: very short patch repair endonuclease [Caulobacteraceae bacterium]